MYLSIYESIHLSMLQLLITVEADGKHVDDSDLCAKCLEFKLGKSILMSSSDCQCCKLHVLGQTNAVCSCTKEQGLCEQVSSK